MTEINFTGGARIGMANASFPFATLKVRKNSLVLNAGIIGNLSFKPTDIISIEPYSGFMSSGLKIKHKVPRYKEKVIFWTFKNPNEIIRQIQQIGFLDNIPKSNTEIENEINERQKQGEFPFKISFAIGVIAIWSILYLIDFFNKKTEEILGNGIKIALGFVFATSILTLVSSKFRKLVLKEGRELKEISRFLYLLIIITGFMLLNLIVFV